jgi:hypothetical protein
MVERQLPKLHLFQHHITIDCFTRPKKEDSAITNAAPLSANTATPN